MEAALDALSLAIDLSGEAEECVFTEISAQGEGNRGNRLPNFAHLPSLSQTQKQVIHCGFRGGLGSSSRLNQ